MGSIPRRLPGSKDYVPSKLAKTLDGVDLLINVITFPLIIAYVLVHAYNFLVTNIAIFPTLVQGLHYRVFFSVSIYIVGSILWLVKKYYLRIYAVLEFAVAFAIAYKTFLQMGNDRQLLNLGVGIAASLFLVVRGYENLEKSKAEGKDKIGKLKTILGLKQK
jgi:hypothetical protein